ncbi:MAG TPA: hypothetical protein DD730_18810 [Desulfosporosinus sp.]|jgi:hypothetical protein|nr:hypothetical protein [Desulfosporosinus sp.]
MTPEQKFWQLLKPHIPGHVNRIENSASVGIPDVNYCYNDRETWLELKANVNWLCQVRDVLDHPNKIRDSQLIWHNQRFFHGGSRILVATRDGDSIKIISALGAYRYFVEGVFPKPWDWSSIEGILKEGV